MTAVAVKKLSVALDAQVAEEAAAAADAQGVSLSAWLNDAAREALAIEDGLAAAREVLAEIGPISDEDRAWADAVTERVFGRLPEDEP